VNLTTGKAWDCELTAPGLVSGDAITTTPIVDVKGVIRGDNRLMWENGWMWIQEAQPPDPRCMIMTAKEAAIAAARPKKPFRPIQVVPPEPPLSSVRAWAPELIAQQAEEVQKKAGFGAAGVGGRRRTLANNNDQDAGYLFQVDTLVSEPEDAPQLSDPESVSSAESISGDIMRPWERKVCEERYRHARDRAVDFSEEWKPLAWKEQDWEKHLGKHGSLAPREERELRKVWKMDHSTGKVTMCVESRTHEGKGLTEVWSSTAGDMKSALSMDNREKSASPRFQGSTQEQQKQQQQQEEVLMQQRKAAEEALMEMRKAYEKVGTLTPRDLPLFRHPDLLESKGIYLDFAKEVRRYETRKDAVC